MPSNILIRPLLIRLLDYHSSVKGYASARKYETGELRKDLPLLGRRRRRRRRSPFDARTGHPRGTAIRKRTILICGDAEDRTGWGGVAEGFGEAKSSVGFDVI